MRTFNTNAYRGRALEITVVASQGGVVRLHQTAPETKFLRGGKNVIKKGPVDFIGCVCRTGRMICFDAKMTRENAGLPMSCIAAHQLDFLCRFGREGAIAGVLAEQVGGDMPGYYWVDWMLLSGHYGRVPRLTWAACAHLGPPDHNIPFRLIPGVLR